MIGAEHALHVGKRRLVELDRLLDTTGRSVGVREAAAGAERVGMLRPQDPHTVAEHLLMERDRLSRCGRPTRTRFARLPWVPSVSGLSNPRIRARWSSTRSYTEIASLVRPADAYELAEFGAGEQRAGIRNAEDALAVIEYLLAQNDGSVGTTR